MKVRVNTSTEYPGREQAPIESFDLEVEGEPQDRPVDIAKTYLELRKMLKEGIKEDK